MLENGTVVTPMFLELGLQCTKIFRFVQYTLRKPFNNLVQSVVDARREGEENPLSRVIAETLKLLVSYFYGYQIMNRSRHTFNNYPMMKKVIMHSMNH